MPITTTTQENRTRNQNRYQAHHHRLVETMTKVEELDGLSGEERQNRFDMFIGSEIRELRKQMRDQKADLHRALAITESLEKKLNNYLTQ